MKLPKNIRHNKEFDTKTLYDQDYNSSEDVQVDSNKFHTKNDYEKSEPTKKYEPKPLTPEDDRYQDILEHFVGSPTKPKYWFEEYGDYWSCSCGSVNRGHKCVNCGLERDLLRSIFILHKPADTKTNLNRKVHANKSKIDEAAALQAKKDEHIKNADNDDIDNIQPIELVDEEASSMENYSEGTQPGDTGDGQEAQEAQEVRTESGSDETPQTPLKINLVEDTPQNQSSPETGSQVPTPAKKSKKKLIIILSSIVILLALLALAGFLGYKYYAAPAMLYDEAQELQANGDYEKAIEKYQSLGDYKDCQEMIWKCYIAMGDDYYMNGQYQEAIDTYAIAQETKDNTSLQEKVNKAKFAYVQAYKSDRTDQVVKYMNELMKLDYPGIEEIYNKYYAWKVKIIANTSDDDYSTNMNEFSREDTIYFHALLSGGKPSETIELYYEVTWPSGSKQIYNLDTSWKSGSKITARFQYPVPLFGREGDFVFKLYNKSTNEVMGSCTVSIED